MTGLIKALAFLTVFPDIAKQRSIAFNKTLIWFPVVGAMQGMIACGIWYLTAPASKLLASAMVISTHEVIRRFLHIDGFVDTVDGFSAGWGDREKILSVMRDSHIGAFGTAALVLLVILKVAALASLTSAITYHALILYPVIGLSATALTALRSDYAQDDPGTGASFIGKGTAAEAILIIALLTILVSASTDLTIYIAAATALAAILTIAYRIKSRIGGHTGDTLGAITEGAEVLFLVFLAIIGGRL